jgi:hypothetical protein
VNTALRILIIFVSGVVFLTRGEAPLSISSNDIGAFVGGGDVSAAQFSGHLESILTRSSPGAKFRNFGWEGDTVFSQPRDYNFLTLTNHLRNAAVTVIFVQFGRMEAFAPAHELKQFSATYESLIANLLAVTPKLILVTPVPLENPGAPLPDLSARNTELKTIANHIRRIATQHNLPLIDLFSALLDTNERLTEDGVQITPRGHAVAAQEFTRELNLPTPALTSTNTWTDPHLEHLRQLIIAKNRLWFDYWRPQNWAFLGGDRTEQPSSRDHRDPKIRWFPKEMEKFATLIADKEKEIIALATKAHP